MRHGPWGFVLFRLAVLVGLAVAAGLVFGRPLAWVVAALAAYLGWQLYHIYRLESWLRNPSGQLPRDALGLWGGIYAQLNRMRRQSRARKKRLGKVIKEFRKSTKALPDGGVVLSDQNDIVWMNAAAQAFLGLRKEDRGQRVENFLRDPEFVAYLADGEFSRPVRMDSPVNPEVKLSVQVVPYGKTQRLLLAKDITNSVRLEKVRRSFVANASHELRSPLTVVTGYLDAMMDDPELPESWKEPAAEMARQSDRMRRIIDDLLTLSRLEAASAEADRDRVDVPGMLSVMKKEALARDQRPSTIELQLDSGAGLLGVESELFSAFANLIDNAIKYTGTDGTVTVRWFEENGAPRLSVSDTGIGIPEAAIPRLTERFYRVDKGRDRIRGGTGLGLAIVKHVLQRHDARLEIESEPGKGSTFTCRFPPERATGLDAEDGPAAGVA